MSPAVDRGPNVRAKKTFEMPKCPICNKDVKARSENAAFPFCTPRCKTIDLGKWMSEEYRVPAEEASPEDFEEALSPFKGDMRN